MESDIEEAVMIARLVDESMLNSAMERMLARALLKLVESPWRSIESAPKDGTEILVYASHGYYVARWLDSDGRSEQEHESLAASGRGRGDKFIGWWRVDDNKHGPYPLRGSDPTHWMPLPAAPKEAKDGE